MTLTRPQAELAEAYARAQGGRAAWFSYAENACDMLAKIGIVAPEDHLIVCADDFSASFERHFRWGRCSFVAEPTPDAFLTASGWGSAGSDVPLGSGDDRLVAEGSPASYAYPAGVHASRTFWFVSTIGCTCLRVPDIRELAHAAARVGALLIVDNTVASVFGCHPIELGAHICLEALDRVAAGMLERKAVAVTVAPAVSGRGRRRIVHPESEDAYRLIAFGLGDPDDPSSFGMLSPDDLSAVAWGLDSLAYRMQMHNDHARAIAEFLSCHPRVAHVFYPGLRSHADAAHAPRVLMHGFGPAIDFSLLGTCGESPADAARRFVADCACANRDAPAGGSKTRMSVVACNDAAYVRIFVGTDDPLAVVDGLDRALRRICSPSESRA